MSDHDHEVEHDDECAEEIRHSGACRHGHAFSGGCDRPECSFKNDQQGDNVCTYCKVDKGENGIASVTECDHFISTDQCNECPTDQVCFDCDEKSGGAISDRILGITR